MIIVGIALLLLTFYDLCVGETGTLWLLGWIDDWLWFDVSRWHNPILYWMVIGFQATCGVAALVMGIMEQ
jgi:hypothetical protein